MKRSLLQSQLILGLSILAVGSTAQFLFASQVLAQAGQANEAIAPPPPAATMTVAPVATVAPAPAASSVGWESVSQGFDLKLLGLSRTKHETVKLKFVFRNTGKASVGYKDFPGVNSSGRFHQLYLRNLGARLEFSPLYSSGSGYFTSVSCDLPPGMECNGWAEFPAPPANVHDVSVAFGTQLIIDDVPVN